MNFWAMISPVAQLPPVMAATRPVNTPTKSPHRRIDAGMPQ
jgi:hypothetical protein